jgi:hypothetical protein
MPYRQCLSSAAATDRDAEFVCTGELVRAAIGRPLLVRSRAITTACVRWSPPDDTVVAVSGAGRAFRADGSDHPVFRLQRRGAGGGRLGPHSVVVWNVYALSFLPGFLRSRVARWIDSTIFQDSSPADCRAGVAAANDHAADQSREFRVLLVGRDGCCATRRSWRRSW